MTSFDVDAIDLAQLRERESSKYRVYPADVIPAWVAEMDFPLAEPIAAALHAAIDRSDAGYRTALGVGEALSAFAAARWGWTLDPDDVTPIADVLSGVAWSLNLFTAPGDGVVVNTPVYPPFFSTVTKVSGRELVDVPMKRLDDGAYDWDLEAMAEAFARPDVTAFVMSNPHNPTGTIPSPEVLRRIVALAQEHGVLIVSDEIHGPLALPGRSHVPLLTVAPADVNAIVLVSASKAWNLPGLKCAQLVGTARTQPLVRTRLPLEVTYGAGHLGAIAAVAAYREGGDWLDDVIGILDANRRLLSDLVAAELPGVGYQPPDASYLAWLDMRSTGLGDDPAAAVLDRGRVALSSGPTYGPGGAGFARLNFATSPAILREIVHRMAGTIEKA